MCLRQKESESSYDGLIQMVQLKTTYDWHIELLDPCDSQDHMYFDGYFSS